MKWIPAYQYIRRVEKEEEKIWQQIRRKRRINNAFDKIVGGERYGDRFNWNRIRKNIGAN